MSRWTDPEYEWNWGFIVGILIVVLVWAGILALLWAVFG